MELLYFDHDHGVERLLFVNMDRSALRVEFRLDVGPDPTYDDAEEDTPPTTIVESTTCGSVEQFDGFCRQLLAAMRETPFTLQDPERPPFTPKPHAAVALDGFGSGVPPGELTCRLPPAIAAVLVANRSDTGRFRYLA